MRGRSRGWAAGTAMAVLLAAGAAAAVSIDVGTAGGQPGDTVTVTVSLQAEGATVIATQNRIDFGRQAFIAAKPNGQPDCAVEPAIDKEATGFRFLPLGCDPDVDCTGVRVFVLSFDNLDAIPDGPLYACRVTIAADTPDGSQPLTLAELGASAPGGVLLAADGTDGTVIVANQTDVRLVVGDASGTEGGNAAFDVTLQLLDAVAAAAVQLDIAYDAATPVAATVGGVPACAVNPAIEKEATSFAFLPNGCEPAVDCTGIRAFVLSAVNTTALPDGADLFACTLDLRDAGTYPLAAANPSASRPDGTALLASAADGTVTVEPLPPPPPPCAGDCDDDRTVAINELLIGVNIVIGASPIDTCAAFDTDADGQVNVAELIQAVNAALSGCPIE